MDARTALNEYKQKGERVDEVLFHIVSEELTRLHDAVQFYANKNNHFVVDMHARSSVHEDGGLIARRALQQK